MVSAFSVPKAKRDEKIPQNPGPGQYNPQNSPKVVNKSDPKYSFGKVERRQTLSPVPGPGSYQPKNVYIVEKNPSFSMLGKKQLKGDKINVGPGQYQPSLNLSKEKYPSYSMSPRSKYMQHGNKLGPGQYELKGQLSIPKKHGIRFSKQGRDSNDKRNIPGPGSYEFENAIFKYGSKQDPSYGFGAKLQGPQPLKVPGPGTYDGKIGVYSKIGGIMSRDLRMLLPNSKTPGPGNYNPQSKEVFKKDPVWSLSKGSRDNMDKSIPLGPGQYQHDKNYKSISVASPGWHFSSDKKLNFDINNVPGPGSYEQNLLKSQKNIKIGQKIKEMSLSHVPGPGSYEFSKYDYQSWEAKGNARYSLAKGSRDLTDKRQVPGPGSYNSIFVQDNKKGKVTFGRDLKLKSQKNNVPGPGQYQLKPYFADVPKYLLPKKS